MAKDTIARIKIKNKLFEIIVDLDLALKLRKGMAVNVQNILLANEVYTNPKTGAKPSSADLTECFGTTDVFAIADRIIKKGDIQLPKDYRDEQQDNKKKKIIDFYSRNAVDAKTGRPFAPQVIESAIEQTGVNIDNKSIEQQIPAITEALKRVIPLKIETKKLSVTIPVIYTGKAYGVINEYKEKEDWLANGDLKVIVNIPVGLQSEFYDKLNSVTHGAALTEEIREIKK